MSTIVDVGDVQSGALLSQQTRGKVFGSNGDSIVGDICPQRGDFSVRVAGCLDPREVGDRRGSQPGFDTGGSGKESHFFGPWPHLRLA